MGLDRTDFIKPLEYVDLNALSQLGREGFAGAKRELGSVDLHKLLEANDPGVYFDFAFKLGAYQGDGGPELKYDLQSTDEENLERLGRIIYRNAIGFMDLKRHMLRAIELKELCGRKRVRREDMNRAGFSISGDRIKGLMREVEGDLKRGIITLRSSDGGNVFLEYEAAIAPKASTLPNFLCLEYTNIAESGYSVHLREGVEKSLDDDGTPRRCTEDGIGLEFYLLNERFPDTSEGYREAARTALDNLFSINLADVKTVTVNGMIQQECNSVYSAFWLLLSREFEGGRAMRCEACGKPLVVYGERGNKRRYCSDACRKWAQRHPGETRSPWRTH